MWYDIPTMDQRDFELLMLADPDAVFAAANAAVADIYPSQRICGRCGSMITGPYGLGVSKHAPAYQLAHAHCVSRKVQRAILNESR